jgi:hypothetical protein
VVCALTTAKPSTAFVVNCGIEVGRAGEQPFAPSRRIMNSRYRKWSSRSRMIKSAAGTIPPCVCGMGSWNWVRVRERNNVRLQTRRKTREGAAAWTGSGPFQRPATSSMDIWRGRTVVQMLAPIRWSRSEPTGGATADISGRSGSPDVVVVGRAPSWPDRHVAKR